MPLVELQDSYFFNSSPTSGATPLGNLGNKFKVTLSNPITLPVHALYASLEVVSARVWYTSPNISAEIGNNHLRFSYNGQSYDITLEDGSYGVEELDDVLSKYFVGAGLSSNLFILETNDAVQKVYITFEVAGVSIDFTGADTIRTVLGFEGIITSTTPGPIQGTLDAKFNRIENYLIKSDIVQSGIPQNDTAAGIIAEVPLGDTGVGDQISYNPFNPLRCDASDLIGKAKQVLTFTLTDQELRDVSTAGEYWSVTVVMRYYVNLENNNSHVGRR
jgi:hypothetical protein